MIGKLIIKGVEVPVTKEIPVSVNYSIADIRDLDKRGGSLTKTLQIFGTKEVNKIFEHCFRLNIELSTFDPNLKTDAVYYIDEKEQIKGDLQLLKIIDHPNGSREFNCNIIGREGALFVAIGDKYLTDIDFSDLNHTYNKTEQKNSWATSYRKSGVATAFNYGDGYVYPLIKYGYSASDTSYDVNYFKPAIAAREYVKRIFSNAGYTWNSGGFFDSAFFKRLYIPCNLDKIQLDNTTIYNSQYYVGKTTATFSSAYSGTSDGVGNASFINSVFMFPNYNLETGSYFDPSNQYDSVTTYQGTIATSGTYNVVAWGQLNITVNAPSLVGGKYAVQPNSSLTVKIQTNVGSGWYDIASITNVIGSISDVNLGTATTIKSSAQTGSIWLGAGSPIRVQYLVNFLGTLKNAGGVAQPSTAYTVDYTIPNGTTSNSHYLLLTSTNVSDGFTMTMNKAIPQNIKQKDFIKSLFNMFNLYAEKNKTNETELIIETRDSFYSASVDDWTSKVDYSKDFEITPMGDLDALNYVWKYKDDKDYYNDLYQKQYIDNYGLKRKNIINDFLKNEKKTELIFSPTPLVSNSSNNIICPHIYQKDTTTIKPLTHNIRILYYGGLKNSGNSWTYTSLSSSSSETQYPYMGHVDDPLTPTIDINFDYPREVYYTYSLAYFTTNNLYNAYYSKFINEITDKDSKIVKCNVVLNATDINKFTFRNKVFINHPEYGGTYFIVNKIINYDPLEPKSTQVELLKLKNYGAFVPSVIPIDPASNPSATSRILYNPAINNYSNTETANTLALGSTNRVIGAGNIVTGGNNNFIDETSTGVSLINCNRVSVVGVTNFVGVGLSDINIDSTYNNTTLDINNQKQSLTIAGSDPVNPTYFNYDSKIDTYYVDCTGGDVTILFDASTLTGNFSVTFIRTDSSAYLFRIDEVSGLPTVIGNAIPYNTGAVQYDSITVTYNNNVFYIK